MIFHITEQFYIQGEAADVPKEKEEEIKNVFPMTMNEWFWLDHILNAQMRTFEDMNAARLYKIAKDEEWANKSAAAAQPSSH